MAMRAQRRTVIDPMYIEDGDVMKVSKIIMGGVPLMSKSLVFLFHCFSISTKLQPDF
jgi:hypothetical protein